MSEGKTYISWATEFDTYKGTLNWQNLSLSERETIARYELEGMPEALDIEEFVMGTNLRRIQFDGLRTIIVRTALALEDKLGVRFGIDGGARYSLILPYLEGTAVGQELVSLLNGTAGEDTNYRMGELEFLAQSGSRPSPLDKLLDLPRDMRLQGILQLLKPRGAFNRQRPTPGNQPSNDAGRLDTLPFQKAMQLIDAGRLNMRASYSGSLQAVAQGIVNVSLAGSLASIGCWATPIVGLVAAYLLSWWWLPIGLGLSVLAFRFSRRAASNAVLHRARMDEAFFNSMRTRGIIWLEDIPSQLPV